jgi:hypothetical protein
MSRKTKGSCNVESDKGMGKNSMAKQGALRVVLLLLAGIDIA